MEIPSQEADQMPIPLNSTYGGEHAHAHTHVNMMHHHHHHHHDPPPSSLNHIISSPPPQIIPPNGPTHISSTHDHDDDDDDDDVHDHTNNNHNAAAIIPFKKPVKYKECLKNHAAQMGGNATDGCGEFMPSGDEGTLEALTCSACNCHRNFHRKETENGPTDTNSKKLYLGHRYLGQDYHHQISSRAHQYGPAHPHHPMIMSYNMGGGGGSLPSESDDGGGMAAAARPAKKRFRTKFSQEQKEKMQRFAEKVGWKMQKQEESVVQQFCQEVGVKRRVLKVWMHNNKHNFANKALIQQQNPNNNNNNSDHNHL